MLGTVPEDQRSTVVNSFTPADLARYEAERLAQPHESQR
jgi:hypothetical protein